MEECNAVIDAATIEIEDHGILTAWVGLDYGGTHQGFGGYAFDARLGEDPGPYAALFIRRVLTVVGVHRWNELIGKTVRVRREDGWGGSIIAIGHIINDDWFEPKVEFEKLKG